jgi:ferredoxin
VTVKAAMVPGKCCGYGMCVEICPQVFKLDDMGFAYVEAPEVPDEFADAAQEACDACPESAIEVE